MGYFVVLESRRRAFVLAMEGRLSRAGVKRENFPAEGRDSRAGISNRESVFYAVVKRESFALLKSWGRVAHAGTSKETFLSWNEEIKFVAAPRWNQGDKFDAGIRIDNFPCWDQKSVFAMLESLRRQLKLNH